MLQEHGIAAMIYGGTVRGRRFPRSESGRRVVRREIPAEAHHEGFRRHDQVPFRSEIRYRGDLRRQLRDDGRPHHGLQLQDDPLVRRGAPHAPRDNSFSTTTSSSSTRKRSRAKQQATCGEPCAAVCKKDERRIQEGLRALPDHGAAVRDLRSARGREDQLITATRPVSTRSASAVSSLG